MILLHTSDWHLGRTLYGRKRYNEFEAFLSWLLKTIKEKKIDILVIAGDIFDTTAPSNRAQELYYNFLCKISQTGCRHVVITSGNHDSPTFLNAPNQVLKALNIHVVTASTGALADQVIPLYNKKGDLEVIVCAVPYLRDRDIRITRAGESVEEKGLNLIEGLSNHYKEVADLATELRGDKTNVPIIGMGHLFATGGRSVDGDGVRELYVGTLAHIGAEAFPKEFDYTALGHLHISQRVGKLDNIRYSGSPIPMGFGEAGQDKIVIVTNFNGSKLGVIDEVKVPVFQALELIKGDFESIRSDISRLVKDDYSVWIEIEYTGDDILPNLREDIDILVQDSLVEVSRIKNRRVIDTILHHVDDHDTLENLTIFDVFNKCLDSHNVTDGDRKLLTRLYHEITIDTLEES